VEAISDTKAEMTLFVGKVVYQRPEQEMSKD